MPPALARDPNGGEAPRLLRARLTFAAPEAPPTLDWLWTSDDAAAQQLAPHLLRYRIPCLDTAWGAQKLVQEFWLEPATGRLEASEVWSAGFPAAKGSCYVRGKAAADAPQDLPELSKALLFFRFVDGAEEPEVQVVHHTGSSLVVDRARRDARQFRRCENGQTTGEWHEILLTYVPANGGVGKFGPIELRQFLSLAKDPGALRAHFDLNTMGCPFDAVVTLNQPVLPNRARSVGARDENRIGFLAWLGSLPLDIPAASQAMLFGESLTVRVPCLVLNLQPSTARP